MSESKLIAASLDLLNEGFGVFDTDLKLAACNRGFAELNQYPEELCRPGTPLQAILRFRAERGDFGPGDADAQVSERMSELSRWSAARFPQRGLEQRTPDGRILRFFCRPVAGGGLALIYQDTTDAHAVETALRASEQRNALIARRRRRHLRLGRDQGDLFVSARLKRSSASAILGSGGGMVRTPSSGRPRSLRMCSSRALQGRDQPVRVRVSHARRGGPWSLGA